MMFTAEQVTRLPGKAVYDNNGQFIGEVRQVLQDEATHTPSWVRVATSPQAVTETFVPLTESRLDAEGLRVAVGQEVVSHAPTVTTGDQLKREVATDLYRYYSAMPHSEEELAVENQG